MQPQKFHTIDSNSSYPCPCHRKGELHPIVLTEALGCDRCQQIFVVQENGQAIEQLSSHYPYKKSWRWSGRQWILTNPALARGYIPTLILMMSLGFAFLLLVTTLQSLLSSDIAFRIVAALVIVMLVAMLWAAYRR